MRFYEDPAAKLLTFDSDLLEGGKRVSPTFRPQWSPDVLLGNNYIGRAVAINAAWACDNFGEIQNSDSAIWEMLLVAAISDVEVRHIPRVLLSERNPKWLTTPDAGDASMVQRILLENGFEAEVKPENGSLSVLPVKTQWPLASIIVPTRHSRENMGRLIRSLRMTDYQNFELIIVDNGVESAENSAWYSENLAGLRHRIVWWTEQPFNYNRVNNSGVSASSGEYLVLLNDDTEIVDSRWLKMLVGHAGRAGVGGVGFQLLEGNGRIQHGGVFIGPGGFADNLFHGMFPHSKTLIGSTDWYRNSLAVTGACVAIRRDHFLDVGGLDENFILMGSDVVLGLDQVLAGRRNLVIPFDMVRHYESLTRGGTVPEQDLFASYWRYHSWLRHGDPYVSPNVSRSSAVPKFAGKHEENPALVCQRALGRRQIKFVQRANIAEEARQLLWTSAVTRDDVARLRSSHQEHASRFEVRTINWFIPEVDMPFFGGLNTAFRIADKMRVENGVRNRFVVLGEPAEMFLRTALDAAFPGLGRDSEIHFYDGSDESLKTIPKADAAVGTLWLTALHVARSATAKRGFYLVQDYEPEFYPASSMFAMAEESYRLGLYGLCNSPSMYKTYVGEYNGRAFGFTPAVDRGVYHPADSSDEREYDPVTIFAYARDHFRNCWELVYAALSEIKKKHGRNVRIIVAGARYLPESADFVDLGLMDYRETALHYQKTDIGVTMQISRHPSYLPLELMACGVPMVSPDSHWFKWLFKGDGNSLESMRSVSDLFRNLDTLVTDAQLRKRLSQGAIQTIDESHSSWDQALAGIYEYFCDPEGTGP
ncbi:rhamnosyltransferase WsaF family glycosyltransferase [Leucobacter sp. Z1108]|uniref:rhamnosyltransferase WsaF family glycosyltransferase n=1 Tax=Leucobacter sp. Z1108 TaxID=3439066 RepID=UPI003F36D9D2